MWTGQISAFFPIPYIGFIRKPLNPNAMMPNIPVLLGAALIPMITGFIWYNPAVMGKPWMAVTGMTEEKAQQGNMPLTFGLSYLLSLFLALMIFFMCVHQSGLAAILMGVEGWEVEGSDVMIYWNDFMERYGSVHRHFGHGALHGGIGGLMIALPVLGTNALFEQKGFKYIGINATYWIITMALMGGVLCQWG